MFAFKLSFAIFYACSSLILSRIAIKYYTLFSTNIILIKTNSKLCVDCYYNVKMILMVQYSDKTYGTTRKKHTYDKNYKPSIALENHMFVPWISIYTSSLIFQHET